MKRVTKMYSPDIEFEPTTMRERALVELTLLHEAAGMLDRFPDGRFVFSEPALRAIRGAIRARVEKIGDALTSQEPE